MLLLEQHEVNGIMEIKDLKLEALGEVCALYCMYTYVFFVRVYCLQILISNVAFDLLSSVFLSSAENGDFICTVVLSFTKPSPADRSKITIILYNPKVSVLKTKIRVKTRPA
jgi:hypothetical protein